MHEPIIKISNIMIQYLIKLKYNGYPAPKKDNYSVVFPNNLISYLFTVYAQQGHISF